MGRRGHTCGVEGCDVLGVIEDRTELPGETLELVGG